jgi:hypothetical protein
VSVPFVCADNPIEIEKRAINKNVFLINFINSLFSVCVYGSP